MDAVYGISSNGVEVAIVIVDFFPRSPDINLLADVVDSDNCNITTQVNFNPDFEVPASGRCLRLNNGEVFRMNQLTLLGNNFGNIITDCSFVADLSSASDLNTMSTQIIDIISSFKE